MAAIESQFQVRLLGLGRHAGRGAGPLYVDDDQWQLGADREAKDVVVHVYGLAGRKTGILKGAATAEGLVELAKKKAQCCPTGKCG